MKQTHGIYSYVGLKHSLNEKPHQHIFYSNDYQKDLQQDSTQKIDFLKEKKTIIKYQKNTKTRLKGTDRISLVGFSAKFNLAKAKQC